MDNNTSQNIADTEGNAPINQQNKSAHLNKFIFAFIVLVVAICIIILIIKSEKKMIPRLKTNTKNNPQVMQDTKKYNQWINCSDPRDAVEDKEIFYLNCSSGILFTDKLGNIIDQITETQGLSDSSSTSLLKKQDKLYIGTQDGLTIYDLASKKGEKISVKEGLINGANVKVFDDSDTIWIATFDGLSLYNPQTKKLTNFTKELADNATSFGVQDLAVSKDSVYATLTANVNTPGSVARYDKQNKIWERFGPSAFGENGQYARIDFFKVVEVAGHAYVSEKDLWESEDKRGSSWSNLTELTRKIVDKDSDHINILGQDGKTLWLTVNNKKIFKYNPIDKSVSEVILKKGDGTNIHGEDVVKFTDNKVWYSSKDGLIEWIDLENNNVSVLPFPNNRPKKFDNLLALIDSEPYLYGDGKIWQYNSENNFFRKIVDLSSNGFDNNPYLIFQPIAGSGNIFVFSQSCGQGCNEPKLGVIDFINKSFKAIEIDKTILDKIKSTPGYEFAGWNGLDYIGYNVKTKEVQFNFGAENKSTAFLSTEKFNWRLTSEKVDVDSFSTKPLICMRKYNFKASNNVFTEDSCSQDIESEQFKWYGYENFVANPAIMQLDKKTNSETRLSIAVGEKDYSPFEHFYDTVGINKVMYAENNLWIATDRGLSKYDINAKKWSIITAKEGLVDNKAVDYLVDRKTVWVNTVAGLSKIDYR